MDMLGYVHIFKYSHLDPEPDSDSLSVWTIILIIIGLLFIIGGIAGSIFYKRKQSQKQKLYEQFSNELEPKRDLRNKWFTE